MKKILPSKRFLIMATLFLVLLFYPLAFSQSTEDSTGQASVAQTIENLYSELDSIINETSTPGAAVAIISTDSIIRIG